MRRQLLTAAAVFLAVPGPGAQVSPGLLPERPPLEEATDSQVPRDLPTAAPEDARHEQELRAVVATGTATKAIYLELSAMMNRQGRFEDAVGALRGAAALEPTLAEPQHRIAVLFWDKVRGDYLLDGNKSASYIQQGIEAEDRALVLQPDYTDALTHKSVLLRLKANASTDPFAVGRLLEEADALHSRVLELERERQARTPLPGVSFQFSEPFEQTMARLQPMRVGGNVRTPAKVRDTMPVYPPIAQSARVQGVVILETLIDRDGTVANARVLRSIPLLDGAALQCVSQWRFAPTELDGRPVAIVMTITVNFVLQ